jgi:hypothetical protein
MAEGEQRELRLPLPEPESSPVAPDPAKAIVECKGIRSTSDFPADLSALSREQIEHHYLAMRNSHDSLTRSRDQLQRRSRELTVAQRPCESPRRCIGSWMPLSISSRPSIAC